jgi:hypothetical protein
MTEPMDRQMPFDLQAEIGVLGSVVLMTEVLDDVAMIVRPDDFYDDTHRSLFTHMVALHESRKKIDDTLLINRLRTAGAKPSAALPMPPRSPTRCQTQPTRSITPRSFAKNRVSLADLRGNGDPTRRLRRIGAGSTARGRFC